MPGPWLSSEFEALAITQLGLELTLEELGIKVPPEPESHEAIGSGAGRVALRWPLSAPGGQP